MGDKSEYQELAQDEPPVELDVDDVCPPVDEVAPVKVRTLDDLAKMGKYAALVLLFTEFCLLQGAANMTSMIFIGAAPYKVSCVGKDFVVSDCCSNGINCHQYSNCSIQAEYEFRSVNVDFNHLCKGDPVVKQSISLQMIGVLIGTVVCGTLSDMFGRLRVLAMSFFFSSLIGIACIFPPDLFWFTLLRALQGPFTGGIIGTFLVYMTEQIPKKHRFTVSSIIAWSFNYILVTLIAYFSGDWRTFQRNVLIASSPALIFYWFVYESPRWLVQHGRFEEAREVLEKIQERDGVDESRRMEIQKLLDVEYQTLHARNERQKRFNFMELFHSRRMFFYVAVISLGVFITSTTNYALAFNLDKLSGSIFVNALILGCSRWIINLACGALDYFFKRLGRKSVHLFCQGFTGLFIAGIAGVFLMGKELEQPTIIRICTLVATSLSTQVFITKSVVTMELFPTLLRNQAISFKSIFSRLGIIVAPQVFFMTSWQTLPYIVLAVSVCADAIIFQLALPETKGQNLPEKMKDIKRKREPLVNSP